MEWGSAEGREDADNDAFLETESGRGVGGGCRAQVPNPMHQSTTDGLLTALSEIELILRVCCLPSDKGAHFCGRGGAVI